MCEVMSNKKTFYTPRGLAQQLRDARKQSGVSQAQMAERMRRTQGWVSQVEHGQISVTPDFLDKWCDALELSFEARTELKNDFSRESDQYVNWGLVWKEGVDYVQLEQAELESKTTHLRFFQTMYIPSILQTQQYTKEMYFAARFFADDSQLTRFLQARLARQVILHAFDKRIDALLTESALRARFASPKVMAAQMTHLAKLSERRMVNIATLPLDQRVTIIPHSNWDVFDDKLAFVELISGKVVFEKPNEVAFYVDAFKAMWNEALHDDDAREFLYTLAHQFEEMPADSNFPNPK